MGEFVTRKKDTSDLQLIQQLPYCLAYSRQSPNSLKFTIRDRFCDPQESAQGSFSGLGPSFYSKDESVPFIHLQFYYSAVLMYHIVSGGRDRLCDLFPV